MFGLPLEAMTMIVSTLGGALMKMWSQSQQDKAEQQKQLIDRLGASEDSVNSARQYDTPNAQWIRRFLVVSFMVMAGFILTAPLLGFNTVVPVEITSGFKLLFLDFTNTATEYLTLEGMVTPEWLPHAIMAVVGMYFGQSIVARRQNMGIDRGQGTVVSTNPLQLDSTDYDATVRGPQGPAGHIAEGDISLNDGSKLILGDSDDLQIYHDGVNNIGHFTYSENDRISVDSDEVKIYRREMTNTDGNANGYASVFISDSDSTGMGAAVVDTLGHGLEYSAKHNQLWTYNGYFGGQLSYGTLSQISDERLKSDIQPITSALDTITQIQGITYTRDGKPMAGVTAQQLETVLPNLVHTNDPDGDCHKCPKDAEGNEIHDYKTVEYMPLISYLIEAVKELTEKVEALEAKQKEQQMANVLDLELENIRNKILQMYTDLLTKAFSVENPSASPEELEEFLAMNSLGEISSQEDDLTDLLDDLSPVSEMPYEEPKEHRGPAKQSEKHERGDIPDTTPVPIPEGMFRKASQKQEDVPNTRKVEDPTGPQKRSAIHERQNVFDRKTVKQLLDKERQRLLRVVEKRNKEFGVVLQMARRSRPPVYRGKALGGKRPSNGRKNWQKQNLAAIMHFRRQPEEEVALIVDNAEHTYVYEAITGSGDIMLTGEGDILIFNP